MGPNVPLEELDMVVAALDTLESHILAIGTIKRSARWIYKNTECSYSFLRGINHAATAESCLLRWSFPPGCSYVDHRGDRYWLTRSAVSDWTRLGRSEHIPCTLRATCSAWLPLLTSDRQQLTRMTHYTDCIKVHSVVPLLCDKGKGAES